MSLLRLLLPTALLIAGCADFPCSSDARLRTLETIPFSYDIEARYTYWAADGSQHVVFSRDEVPDISRYAVLVHIPGKTSGDLHGAVGWTADVSVAQPVATLEPMANARARAFAAMSGEWRAHWVRTSAEVTVVRQGLRVSSAEESTESKADAVKREFLDQGVALDELDLQRALRNVSARQPQPRDFGLSVEVEPAWLFVDPACEACDQASQWLDARGIGHHSLLVSDPTNAAVLRSLSADAKPVVPTLWLGSTLVSGFEPTTYEQLQPAQPEATP